MIASMLGMIARLQSIAPQKKGLPADYQYIVEDSVAQVGLDAPILKRGVLAITPGVATYTLPVGFTGLVDLPTVGGFTPTSVADSGKLYRMGVTEFEEYQIDGNQITFTPTPTLALSRSITYTAGYELDADNNYPTLSMQGMRAALLFGQYLVFLSQAGIQSHSGWSYTIGDETVTKSNLSKAIADHSKILRGEYDLLIERMNRIYGSRSATPLGEYIEQTIIDPYPFRSY